MSRVIGFPAEFNPFHSGHAFLVKELKERHKGDAVVAVMSGPAVQRGDFSYFHKKDRVRKALEGGVDLVFELPTVFATGSAPLFARGSVEILEKLGFIDCLAFGSESGNIEELIKVSRLLEVNEQAILNKTSRMRKIGKSYPKAREDALVSFVSPKDASRISQVIGSPNNILALEYLRHKKNLVPLTIKRQGAGHHKSATEMRSEFESEYEGFVKSCQDRYFAMLKSKILSSSLYTLRQISGVGSGLEHALYEAVRKSESIDDLIGTIKSKVYTETRIRRTLLHILLGITKNMECLNPSYAMVLGASEKGRKLLKKAKKEELSSIDIYQSLERDTLEKLDLSSRLLLSKDILAQDIQNIILGRNLYRDSDFVMPMVIY